MPNDPWYFQGGFQYGVLDDTTLVIEPFAADLWKGIASGFNNEVVDFPDELHVDLRTVGINGRDSGVAGTPPDGCYKVWLIADPSALQPPAALVTKTLDIRNIVFPSGYGDNRKAMGGVVVRSGRLLPFHAAHWPMPRFTFTDREQPDRVVWSGGGTGAWTLVDLSGWIPENCRLGHFRGRVAGGSGTIWISPSGGSPPNPYWRTLIENQSGTGGTVDCRVDGNQHLWIWTQGSATFQLIIEGFSATEVS